MSMEAHRWTLHDVPCSAGCGADDITCEHCGRCQECAPSTCDLGCPSPVFCDRAARTAARQWCKSCVAEGRELEERQRDAHVVAWRSAKRRARRELQRRDSLEVAVTDARFT